MKLVLNGEETEVAEELSVSDLLVARKVKMPEMVSVELNDRILKRQELSEQRLSDGDRVELLYFMGGGR